LKVGLTGGIACGKSRVLRRLGEHGFRTLDLDAVAHEVMAPGRPAYADVVAAFGERILAPGGEIDRKALGALVFADPAARARLNAIVHPRVWEEERKRAPPDGEVLVVDAALLVETGAHLRFDRLVVVDCEPAEQLRRLVARDALSEAAARARIDAQMPVAEKRRFAHSVVDASGTLAATDRAADDLARELRALLPRPAGLVVPPERAAGALVHGPRTGPRGLTAASLLREIADAGGIQMERIARRLDPPPTVPWYRAGEPSGPGPGAEALMAPLVLWALAQSGPDPAFVVAAAASLARLVHSDDTAVADACLFALLLYDVAVTGGLPADLPERARGYVEPSTRWGGAPPTDRPLAVARAAAAGGGGPEPELWGALRGLAEGAPVDRLPAAVRESLGLLARTA
jgi:dephospho-CoA kinase